MTLVPGSNLLRKDGSRIWLQNVHIMDVTGSVTVSVREKAALAWSGLESVETFKSAHEYDNLCFPVL